MVTNRLDTMDMNNFLTATFQVSDLFGKSPQDTFSLNTVMVKLLVSLDGKTPMGKLAGKINVTNEQLRGAAEKLINQGLIDTVEEKIRVLDAPFYEYLSAAMARVVGPIAPILIDDSITGLGYQRASFPVDRVAELIHSLSVEIQEKDKRLAFQKYMIKVLKDRGYLNT